MKQIIPCPVRFVAALLLLVSVSALRAAEADIIVYGATPGGFCAAIAAAGAFHGKH